jgi:hypothetical protein
MTGHPRRPVAEKILAVAGTYSALATELEGNIDPSDPRVQAALLTTATAIAMASDTKDIGLLAQPKVDTFVQKVANGSRVMRPKVNDIWEQHQRYCRCPNKPWCEPHIAATTDPSAGICQTHDHHIG